MITAMPFIKITLIIVLLIGYYYSYVKKSQTPLRKPSTKEGFRSTKCFSCEAQDFANGIYNRGHGSKCFSCERQSMLPHPTKCFSCQF